MKLHIKVWVFTVITRARRSSYDCNEKGCHPWVFSLLQCALLAPMAAPLTGFNAVFFSKCFVAPRLTLSLTSCHQPPKDTRPNNRKKYLWEESVCGSLRGRDCCENITLGKQHRRQRGFFFSPVCLHDTQRFLERENAAIGKKKKNWMRR